MALYRPDLGVREGLGTPGRDLQSSLTAQTVRIDPPDNFLLILDHTTSPMAVYRPDLGVREGLCGPLGETYRAV